MTSKLFSNLGLRPELNAFFTFFFDIVVTLFVMLGLLSFVGFPVTFIIEKVTPALALGVLLGNLVYSRMAISLSRQTGEQKTAIPLGIDITSVVAIILLIVGPSLQFFNAEFEDPEKALLYSWYVGMGTSLWLGIIKFALAFCNDAIRRFIPMAGMLGSIAGVAFVWLGANPVLSAFQMPLIGLLALIICIVSLMAHVRLPVGAPGAFVALLICLPLYYVFESFGFIPEHIGSANSADMLGLHLPYLQMGGLEHLFGYTLGYLAIIAPLAILVSVIATNIVAAARLSNLNYSTRNVIIADAAATFTIGLFGGVGQTTPYLGIETYKRMGAGHLYCVFTIIAMLVICFSGLLNFMLSYIPEAVFLPLLVIVCIDIISLAFSSSKTKESNHTPAIIVAMIPAVINLAYVKMDELLNTVHFGLMSAQAKIDGTIEGGLASELHFGLNTLLSNHWYNGYYAMRVLSQGYILTAIFWGATVALMMDKRLKQASYFLAVASVFSLFGIIHSVTATGSMYLPWDLPVDLAPRLLSLPYEISGAYFISALFLFGLSFQEKAAPKS
ncbi:hypothetical protein [uncultured Paraglaciecola sp.]|uniref:hypothetical protein n=1 Tax=uncultured Paraglaciecola sp. TaxID=1765024 RepID=UPI00259806D2|nr:hypothetical protein [uncultured Paraglaciecola sp.]